MRKTLKEIAAYVNGEVIGDENTIVTGVAGIRESSPGDITFLANTKYLPFLNSTQASAVITSKDVTSAKKPLIHTDNPSLAFIKVVSLITPSVIKHPSGVHQSAVLGKNVTLGKDVSIGPYAVIADNVSIGDKSIIYSGSFIGEGCVIGKDTLIYPNVTVRERTTIGERVIIHSGTVIGSDGFGFVTVDDVHHKIPQTGCVEIGNDVEIGANVTIDRARFDKTIIGSGTKIDNLVHIAHNVTIGENSLIVAQVGISGSTKVGKNVILAGQVGLVGHIEVGDNFIAMAQAGVSKSFPANTMVLGSPAIDADEQKRIFALTHMLPKLFDGFKELKKKIEDLENKLKGK